MTDQIQEIARLLCIQSNGDGLMSKIRQTIELLQEASAERDQMRTELGDGTTGNKYRAELYDEVWQKARDMGFGNVTNALSTLEVQRAEQWSLRREAEAKVDTQAAIIAELQAELAKLRAGQEPVAYITGQFAGRCVIEAINRAAVLPTGMALYSAPQPSAVPDGWSVTTAGDSIIVRPDGRMAVELSKDSHLGERVMWEFMRALLAAAPSATATVQGDATKIDRPLIRNAISLLRLRRPVPPDVERVAADLEAMLDGLPTPAGEPSAAWLEVAAVAAPRPAEVCDVCDGKGYVNVGDGDAQVACPFCDLPTRQEGGKV